MAEPRFVLENATAELSQDGTATPSNPLFVKTLHGSDRAARVKPGDVAVMTARIDTSGYHRPSTVLPAVQGIAWSVGVDNAYTAAGAASDPFDATFAGVSVWVKCSLRSAGVVRVDVTALQSGIVSTIVNADAPAGTDAGIGSSTGTTPLSGTNAPAGTDAGLGADTVGTVPIAAGAAPTGFDNGVGNDTGVTPVAFAWSDNGKLLAEPFTHADTSAGTGASSGLTNWTLIRDAAPMTINIASNKLHVAQTSGPVSGYMADGQASVADAVIQMRAPSIASYNFGLRGRVVNHVSSSSWTGYTNLFNANTDGTGIYTYRNYPAGTLDITYSGAADIPPANGLMTLGIAGTGAHGFVYYQNGTKISEGSAANPTSGSWGFFAAANNSVSGAASDDFDNYAKMKPCPGFNSANAVSSTNPICGAAITNLPSGWYVMYWDGTNYAKSVVGTGSGVTRTDLSGLDFTTSGVSGITAYFHNGDPGTTYNNAGTVQSALTTTGRYSGAAGSF